MSAPAGPTSGTARPVVEVRDVAVHFGGVKAVDGLSLHVLPGQIAGILGPNGSGKSTLLAALTRFVDLTSGSIRLQGEEYHDVPAVEVARRGIARTFQTVRLLSGLSVLENVQLGADRVEGSGRGRFLRLAPPGRRRSPAVSHRVARALERTGLTGLERAWPGELSYGMQRRVEIARAIASEPHLLLLDEPTAGMNRDERQDVSALLRDLRGEGLTQLLVEHDVQMMVDTCDRLYAMNFGRLIAQGSPVEVMREPAVREAYLGKRWGRHAGDP